ncbi:MAG: anti-sigma factor domain-containing protein [Clostridia bacterium]
MKAIIVETRNKYAAMLSDDGCIVKVRNKNYSVGQEVDTVMTNKIINIRSAMLTAAACLVLLAGIAAATYYTPTRYVSLDVNPSIEYKVNMYNRVISAKGVNDDGTEIIDGIQLGKLKNKKITEAVSLTIDEIADEGYLDNEGANIVLTASANLDEDADELAEDLEEAANKAVKDNGKEANVTSEAIGAERVAEAQALGVTPGKLNLVEKLIDSSDDPTSINKTEWLNRSVKEILAATNENKAEDRPNADNVTGVANQEEHGNGNGRPQDAVTGTAPNVTGTANIENPGNAFENAHSNVNGRQNDSTDVTGVADTEEPGKGNGKPQDVVTVTGTADTEDPGKAFENAHSNVNGRQNDSTDVTGVADTEEPGKGNGKPQDAVTVTGTADTEDKSNGSENANSNTDKDKGNGHN